MPCEFVSIPGGGRAFICGSKIPIRKRCHFCKAREAKALCDWPMRKPIKVKTSDVKVGDVFISPKSQLHTAVVESYASGVLWCIRVLYPTKSRTQPPPEYTYQRYPEEKVFILGQGTCDAPCCFACRRHVGPDRDYCRDHWHAWESVYGRAEVRS